MTRLQTRKQLFGAAGIALSLIFGIGSASLSSRTTVEPVVDGPPTVLAELVVEDEVERPVVARDEVLWLARVIYSETKKPEEQELVAWVVRNRVETAYRGHTSYRSVVLDPYQFSAFNRGSSTRRFYSALNETSRALGWRTALQIAERVAMGDPRERPFSPETRHFYSERSMIGRKAPAWALNKTPVELDRPIDPRRFRFYEGIA